jgi:L-xylulokinase
MATYFLGIDNGGTMAKAALFDAQGQSYGVTRRKIPLQMPQSGWMEIDAETLWSTTAEAIRELLTDSEIAPTDIVAVACTGYGNGLYLVDDEGHPTRMGISSSDSRAQGYVTQWDADGTIDRIRPKTLQCNWGAQPNALLRWMQEHEPDTIERSRWVLMCKDYIRMRLTGEAAAELTDYSGTSLLNVPANDYDDELFQAFGIEGCRHLMPPLIGSTEAAGTITSEAAAETGLAEGTAVFGGLFDIDACGLAAGCVDQDNLVMVGGTWGINQFLTREPLCSPDIFMVSRYAIDDYYLVLEGSATSASNLEWFIDQILSGERQHGEDVYDLCNQLVADSELTEDGPLFLPFLYASPIVPDGQAAFLGLTGATDRAGLVRSVFEGVVFMHHWHYDRLMPFRKTPTTITMTGGIARSEIWCQMFADTFGVPVEVPRADELGALGAAIAATVGAGSFPDISTACAAMTGIARRHEPDDSKTTIYESKYQRFLATVEAMKAISGSVRA